MKNNIIILLTSFFFVSNLNAQLYQDWKWLHQSPQGNDLRWVKMWDVNTIYAIGAKGTFVKTSDRGANWIFQHKAGRMSGVPLQRADLRKAWFFNLNTGIVVGAYGSIFRTTDGGVTFDSVPGNPASTNSTITGIFFINDYTGYVISGLTNYRLMKTTDGGLNWNASYGTAPPYTNPLDLYVFNENKLLVLNQLGDVCISTNGGYLWNTYAIGSQVNFNKVIFLDANSGFACGDWGRCRYTTNGGYNWTNMSGVLFDRSIHFSDIKYRNNAVFLTGSSNYLWHSSNLGVTWDSLQIMSPQTFLPWSNSFYSTDISITGDTMVTVGAHGSIHQTVSSNKTALSQYLKIGSLRDIWASSSLGTVISVGSPSSASSSLITHDQILRSSNGGINWTVISPSPTSIADFYSIDMLDANTGFICGNRSAVYKTVNSGLNWDSLIIPNIPAGLILSKVDFVNAQTGWIFSRFATGNDSTIFKTTNGGVNWFKQKFGTISGNENSVYVASMLDENNGWILNPKPRPWKTTNGGVTWDSTALSDNYLAGSLYGIKMLNPLTGYCVGSNNKVYKTTNGGTTPWISTGFSSSTIITLYTLEFTNSLEGVVMGTYGTSYYTSNGGVNWTNTSLLSSIDDIYGSYLTSDGKIFAVTLVDACIFKNSNMISVGINNYSQEIPREYNLMQNYPNPFNPTTNIKFSIPSDAKRQTSDVKLIIFNILGRETATLVNEQLKPGTYEVTFDGSNLSSGIYFYKLTTGKYSETKKMIMIK